MDEELRDGIKDPTLIKWMRVSEMISSDLLLCGYFIKGMKALVSREGGRVSTNFLRGHKKGLRFIRKE